MVRLPIVNNDDGTWGDILRDFIMKEHLNDDNIATATNGGHKTITIAAGTASANTAPLKFTSGTLLSTPEPGAIEFYNDTLYFTQTTGPTRTQIVTNSSTQTLTNKTINAPDNTITNIAVTNLASSTLVTESEGIASNDNDSTLPTSAAVKDYADTQVAGKQAKFMTGTSVTGISTAAKAVTLDSPWASHTPVAGDWLVVTLTNGNSVSNITLAVNGGSATVIETDYGTGSSAQFTVEAGGALVLRHDGTKFRGFPTVNNSYSTIADVDIVNTGQTTGRLITGQRAETLMANEASVARTLANKTIADFTMSGTTISDTNGNELLQFNSRASAVNNLRIWNKETGDWPEVEARGGDTNIGIWFSPKGNAPLGIWNTNASDAGILVDGSTNKGLDFTLQGTGRLKQGGINIPTISSIDTLTNKTINASDNTITNITVTNLAGSTLVTESEGIASNDNDSTLPTTAAVRDYTDTQAANRQARFMTGTIATAGATAAKTVTLDSPWAAATPAAGDFFLLTYTLGSAVSSSTISINGNTARAVRTTSGQTSSGHISIEANAGVLFHFDGTYMRTVGVPTNTSYSAISQAEIINTASATARLMTGQRAEDLMVNEATVVRTLTGKTIDAANNTITNLDVADFAASSIVTESEGIASNDNDSTLPTSAAVKDYVDSNSSASGWKQVLNANLQNTVPVYVALTGWNFSNSSGQQIHIVTHIGSGTGGAQVYLEHKQGNVGAIAAYGVSVSNVITGGASELAWWADAGTSTIYLRLTMSTTSNDWRNALIEVASAPTIGYSTSTVAPIGASWTALPGYSALVSTNDTQTLTNKTLTAPVFSGSYSFGGTPSWPTFNQSTTGSAATLTTSRNFQTDLASTSAAGFNGSANNTHGVTGTLGVANGGTGRATSTTAYGIIAAGTTAAGAQQTIAPGTSGHFLKSGGGSALASFAAITAADITGTTAQFNTALSDGDFATLAGNEVLTNKTVNGAINSGGAIFSSSALSQSDRATVNFGTTPLVASTQFVDTGAQGSSFANLRYAASANGPYQVLAKSRGATIGARAIVQQGDQLGSIAFDGDDGTDFVEGARIRAVVDGTPGAADMPTRLEFLTTPDGANQATLAMTIKSNNSIVTTGDIELGHSSDTTLARGSAGRLTVEGVNVPTISSADTLTNKIISGSDNTLTNIPSSAVTGMTQLYQSVGNMVIDPSFENDASWMNAWGVQSTDTARHGTKSRKLTATGAGRTTDRIILTHDGTGTPITIPTAGDDMRYWVFAHLRKHAGNTGGGTVHVTVRYIDTSGVEQILHSSDVTANSLPDSSWNRHWAHAELGTDGREVFAAIEIGSDVPIGDQFYLDQVALKDVSAINLGSGTSQTLTNKTISGNDNILTDIDPSSIYNVTDLMGSEMVIGGDFQTDSNWTNAFGAQSTDQSLISGGKSRMITSTGSGATVDRLGLLHDGAGGNIGKWANQPRSHTWRVTIRKHASNAGGGNILLRTRWTDYAGSSFTTTTTYAHSAISNSGFSNLVTTHSTTSSYRYFYCYVEMDSVPSGDIYYVGSASLVDNSGSVTPTATQTLSNKTLSNYTEELNAIGTVTSSYTFDLANGNVQTATLTASTACTFTMPTATAGKALTVFLKQAAVTGNGSATFSGVKWNASGAPTVTPTAGKMDILSFYADGTNWYGSFTQGYTP